MDKIRLTIDGVEVRVKTGTTVLQAAQSADIYIPALCSHPDLPSSRGVKADEFVYRGSELIKNDNSAKEFAGCQLCVVEIEGTEGLPTACTTEAAEGMEVHTNTPQVQEKRQDNLKLILVEHPNMCLTCVRKERCSPYEICLRSVKITERCLLCPKNGHCELQKVADYIGVDEIILPYAAKEIPLDKETPLFDRDYNLCIGCTRCVRVCQEVYGVDALGFVYQDGKVIVGAKAPTLKEAGCKFCGACAEVCPTGAIMDRDIELAEREAKLVPCRSACPAGIDVPRYIRLIKEEKFAESVAVIREKVPFPATLGHICPHFCEEKCRRCELNEPIAIRVLKRFAAEHDTGLWKPRSKFVPFSGKRVAIIGSGPAGLTGAYYLTKLGHSVTVFEALPVAGGMMRVGIPEYRLPKDILDAEIGEIRSVGADIRLNTRIESIDELFEQGYEAIFVSVGAHRGINMGIEGETTAGVVDGTDFLREVSLGEKTDVGRRIIVIGGGNVAVDVSRTALRLGAREATIAYRRTRAEMPARDEEVEKALGEGVKILYLAAPTRVTGVDGKLKVEFIKMELGEPDASGRRRPVPIKGSEFTADYDIMIKAVGEQPEVPDGYRLSVDRGGRLKAAPDTLATSREGVYAGGDVVTGPASVIEAIAAGRQAAISIDRYLGGRGEIDETLVDPEKANLYLGREKDFADRHRALIPCLPVEQRLGSFAEVELGFDKAEAAGEAKRCLQCDLRLGISPPPSPPEKRPGVRAKEAGEAGEKEKISA